MCNTHVIQLFVLCLKIFNLYYMYLIHLKTYIMHIQRAAIDNVVFKRDNLCKSSQASISTTLLWLAALQLRFSVCARLEKLVSTVLEFWHILAVWASIWGPSESSAQLESKWSNFWQAIFWFLLHTYNARLPIRYTPAVFFFSLRFFWRHFTFLLVKFYFLSRIYVIIVPFSSPSSL